MFISLPSVSTTHNKAACNAPKQSPLDISNLRLKFKNEKNHISRCKKSPPAFRLLTFSKLTAGWRKKKRKPPIVVKERPSKIIQNCQIFSSGKLNMDIETFWLGLGLGHGFVKNRLAPRTQSTSLEMQMQQFHERERY